MIVQSILMSPTISLTALYLAQFGMLYDDYPNVTARLSFYVVDHPPAPDELSPDWFTRTGHAALHKHEYDEGFDMMQYVGR